MKRFSWFSRGPLKPYEGYETFCDETWLPHLDFRNKKWRRRGMPNTMSTKQLSPKVNMIAALDTDGRLYLSLT